MVESSYVTILMLGFVLGLRHALDTDHIAAVSTVLAQRPSWHASSLVGLSWGLGHTVVLLLVGALVLVLRVPIPEPIAMAAEFAVGVMLVVLGSLLGIKLVKEQWHMHQHDHDGTKHVHLHSHAQSPGHGHPHWWRESVRPLCIGMAHGLAGSAALLLLVVASAHSVMEGLVYIAVFGCGSILGMMLIGLVLSFPVVWSLRLGQPVFLTVQGVASLGSVGLGLSIIYRILMGEPLS
ncbi:MAG TPA: sulfite exporter TauE/SafE family protein [Nitrospira sp.]|nr:sulfite exporter TauE/SafE family protein [Nitrospira sp.]